jgi:predicted O-methyltransferase YrrM
VLECGSGLTTLVLAAISRHTASDLWSLEHDPHWHQVTNQALQRFGLRANLRLARLRSYGDFDWYDIDPSAVPDFSVVVCDGPPNSTRGGRYGLFPVLRDRLTADCVILLDDAERRSEHELVRRWSQEESWAYEIRGEDRRFAVIVPAGAVPPEQNPTSREPVTVRARSAQRLALVVACIAVMLAGFVALPEALGDRPYDPCPSCAVQEVHR